MSFIDVENKEGIRHPIFEGEKEFSLKEKDKLEEGKKPRTIILRKIYLWNQSSNQIH